MIFPLAIQNLKERKFRTLLASLSIAIGIASLVVFMGLSDGIQQATFNEMEKKSPLTQITVHPNTTNTGIISLIGTSEKAKLNDDTIKQLSQISGIKNIYPENQFNNFSSLDVNVFGMTLTTETMVFGLPKEYIKDDLASANDWDKTTEPYPAIIPRKLLDLYNLTIASPQNLPLFSEKELIGKDLIFYPNYSTFFPQSNDQGDAIKLKVVGFSDKVNLIGVTLPSEIVKKLNAQYTKNSNNSYPEIFVETNDAAETPSIGKEIEKIGYSTSYFQKNLQDVDAKFAYLKNSLGIISLIILLTATIAIISTFLATVAERRREIGLFRALGATKNNIKNLILLEAGLTGLIGSVIGIIIALITSKIIDKIGLAELQKTTFTPETLFQIGAQLLLSSLVFGILLSMFAAYLPAQKAASISPFEALNRS